MRNVEISPNLQQIFVTRVYKIEIIRVLERT